MSSSTRCPFFRATSRWHTILLGVVLATVVSLLFAPPANAKDRFPYTVYAAVDETAVLSGPGEDFYATDLLAKGTPLEVHRRDADGWLAVRPPERSFSWVPARKLLVAANNQSATVVGDDAVAWIGSRVETVEDHRWQVSLERGERVAILGHRALEDQRKGTVETWYQIAPPSGEFRWVHADDITRRTPRRSSSGGANSDEAAREDLASSERDVAPANAEQSTSDRSAPASDVARSSRAEDGRPSDVQRANLTTPRGGSPSEPRSIEPAQFRAEWSPRSTPRQARRADPGFLSAEPATPAPTTSPATEREIEDITLQLSMLAAREPNLWNLAPLRARTENLIERGSNPLERGKARLMLEKIEEFEELQQRHIRAERGLAGNAPPTGAAGPASASPVPGAGAASAAPSTLGGIASALPIGSGLSGLGFVSTGKTGDAAAGAPGAVRSSSVEPRFDGTGWLLPVHSTKRVAPPYALMDDNGQVIQYVSPAPGLNLHRYERKRVGIYGQRGQTQTLNAPLLTAHRVIDLDRQAQQRP